MQPLRFDRQRVLRFRCNAIVSHLLDFASSRGCGLNELAVIPFSMEDRRQLAQLIGYSLSGYSELPYVSDSAWTDAESARIQLMKGRKRK